MLVNNSMNVNKNKNKKPCKTIKVQFLEKTRNNYGYISPLKSSVSFLFLFFFFLKNHNNLSHKFPNSEEIFHFTSHGSCKPTIRKRFYNVYQETDWKCLKFAF